jgi:uridine kinase
MQPPFLVGLTGLSGSGKTTFLHRLQDAFPEQDLCVISQDNYYKPKEQQPQDAQGVHNFDRPTSIDRAAFYRDIVDILAGKTVRREEYTFNNSEVTPKMLTFEPRPIVLIEGLFIYYYEEIRALLNLKLFLHAQETTAFTRRIKRDRLERNYPLEDVLYRYQQHVLPSYEHYIKPFQKEADIVVNNHHNFDVGLEVVTAYLRSVLEQQKQD